MHSECAASDAGSALAAAYRSLATLPLGRGPATSARWLGSHAVGAHGRWRRSCPSRPVECSSAPTPAATRSLSALSAEGGTRTVAVGDPLLPRLLALRALGTGARLQVVTAQPDGWLKLRSQARLPSQCMAVVRSGAQPPSDGTGAAPWMIINDTGSPAAASNCPWQSVVTVPGDISAAVGAQSGVDAIVLQRTTPGGASAVAAALGLPGPACRRCRWCPTPSPSPSPSPARSGSRGSLQTRPNARCLPGRRWVDEPEAGIRLALRPTRAVNRHPATPADHGERACSGAMNCRVSVGRSASPPAGT